MEIFMAVMFFVTNLFIIMIMRLTMVSSFEYKAGMYLGVHIPAEKKEDAEVTSLMSRTKKQFNVFNNINIVLSIVICGICVVNMIISIFIYILWIFVYTVGIQLIVIVGHRKMYELKMKNGWLIEEQKKVYIDTRLSASNGKTSVSMKYHWMLIVLTAVIYILLFDFLHIDI